MKDKEAHTDRHSGGDLRIPDVGQWGSRKWPESGQGSRKNERGKGRTVRVWRPSRRRNLEAEAAISNFVQMCYSRPSLCDLVLKVWDLGLVASARALRAHAVATP